MFLFVRTGLQDLKYCAVIGARHYYLALLWILSVLNLDLFVPEQKILTKIYQCLAPLTMTSNLTQIYKDLRDLSTDTEFHHYFMNSGKLSTVLITKFSYIN